MACIQLDTTASRLLSAASQLSVHELVSEKTSGYPVIREIYEQNVQYLFPEELHDRNSNFYKVRMNLYRNYSHEADVLFKNKLLELIVELPAQVKSDIYLHAWNTGHSNGHAMILQEFQDAVTNYRQMTIQEFEQLLNI